MAPSPKKTPPKKTPAPSAPVQNLADSVAPERLVVMRPLSFNRTANAAPDPKLVRQRAQQEAGTQALVAAFNSTDENGDSTGIDAAAMQKALKAGANINAVINDLGQTALHVAVNEDDLILVAQLLRAGANTRARDNEGLTPLIRALREGDEAMSGLLARAEEKPEAQVSAGRHAIHDAAAHGHVETIVALIARGVSPTIRDVDGDSPLLEALKNEKLDAAFALAYAGGAQKELLKQYQVAVDTLGGYDRPDYDVISFLSAATKVTPPALKQQPATLPPKLTQREEDFFIYLFNRDADSINAAMKKRPDMNVRNEAGDTPLIVALRTNWMSTADYFAPKSDVKATGKHGQTALHVAAAYSSHDGGTMVRQLIELGANVNAQDEKGRTPLMVAALAGSEENAALLLAARANIDIKDNLGFTAKQHARIALSDYVEDQLAAAEKDQRKAIAAKAAKQAFKASAAPKRAASVMTAAKAPAKPAAKKPAVKKPAPKSNRYR